MSCTRLRGIGVAERRSDRENVIALYLKVALFQVVANLADDVEEIHPPSSARSLAGGSACPVTPLSV